MVGMNQKVSVRQKKFAPAERAELLADYRFSGLTQREFVAKAGISLACLCIWLRREKEAGGVAGRQVSFMEIPSQSLPLSFLTPVPSAPAEAAGYKVHFPGGLSIEVPRGFSTSEARDLLNLARTL